jgi:PPM family protein phosphatase
MPTIPLTKAGPEDGGNFQFAWTRAFLQSHFFSDVGKKRRHNEDSCILCAPDDPALENERGILFAVADGMGGASAGEFASSLALETLAEEYYGDAPGGIPRLLENALQQANRRVFAEAEQNPEYQGMGTTVSAVVIRGDCAYAAQVGDSRVYISRPHEPLRQITDDHSLVAEQVRNGFISEDEARTHSLKNLITRAVGIKDAIKIDLFSFRIREGDTLLICSDGLSNMLEDKDIAELMILEDLNEAGRRLIDEALERGGTDNVSVVLIRVVGTPTRAPMDHGAAEVTFSHPTFFQRLKRLMS